MYVKVIVLIRFDEIQWCIFFFFLMIQGLIKWKNCYTYMTVVKYAGILCSPGELYAMDWYT